MSMEDFAQAMDLWTRTPGMGLNAVDDSREGIERFLRRNPGMSFVAMDGARLVGTALCGHDGRRGTLYHVCVHEGYRGRGLGKRLTNSALDALRAEGIRKAGLVCMAANEAGNAFWRAQGWPRRTDLHYYNRSLFEESR